MLVLRVQHHLLHINAQVSCHNHRSLIRSTYDSTPIAIGLLGALLTSLRNGTDVLVQLNVVSMVARLVESSHARSIVTTNEQLWHTLMSLAYVPQDIDTLDPFAPLLIAAIVKLIALLAHTHNVCCITLYTSTSSYYCDDMI
jgi:hypothetical protein